MCPGSGCSSLDTKPLEETMAELGAGEFLELLVDHGLESVLENVTIFVPDDDAIRDMDLELEEMYLGHDEDNVVYNIDDGLVTRKKRSLPMNEGSVVANMLKGHIVPGFRRLQELVSSELVSTLSAEGEQVRVTVYPTQPEPTVMANCAKVTSR